MEPLSPSEGVQKIDFVVDSAAANAASVVTVDTSPHKMHLVEDAVGQVLLQGMKVEWKSPTVGGVVVTEKTSANSEVGMVVLQVLVVGISEVGMVVLQVLVVGMSEVGMVVLQVVVDGDIADSAVGGVERTVVLQVVVEYSVVGAVE